MTSDRIGVLERINMAEQNLLQTSWIKDMTNSQFSSVDIDQIRREVGEAETKAGLVVVYTQQAFEPFPMGGKTYCKIDADLTYYSIDDEEMEHGVTFHRSAIGFDTLDKGFNKAESILYKNHYKGLYHIGERQDDPDQYSNEEYDLIEAFRYAAKYKDKTKPDYKPMYDSFMKLVTECLGMIEAEEKAKKIEERKKAAESFMSGGKKDPADDKTLWAKAMKCKDAIIAYNAVDPEHPHEVILAYAQRENKPVSQWSAGVYLQCYKDLKASGARVLEVDL